jgi:uncharacterized protein YkwD
LFALLSIALVAALVVTPSASAATKVETWRAKLFGFVNGYRVDHGLRPLRENEALSRKAQWHSIRMARRGTLFHTKDLERKLSTWDPRIWGENVGAGDSIWHVYLKWVNSYAHRANLLRKGYTHAGVGVVRARGLYWITMIFYG